MRQTKGFDKNHCYSKDIYIWGTGTYGELAYYGLKALNIQPAAFVDSNNNKKTFLNLPVVIPEELLENNNCVVLLAALNSFRYIYSWCVENEIEEYYDIMPLIELDYDVGILSFAALKEKRESYKYKEVIDNIDNSRIVINHCEIVLTERCSLKCKDCSNLMQYYKKPEDIDKTNIIHSFSNMLKVVDSITNLKLLGGEPFLYKDICEVLELCKGSSKVLDININTNGTIIPRQEIIECLKSDKVSVAISNYGNASKQKDALYSILKENGIKVFIGHEEAQWKDLGDLRKRNYSESQVSDIYKLCGTARCNTLYRGGFYRCPRAAHGERLGVFNGMPQEYVEFNGNIDVAQKKEEILRWLDNFEPITACYYCNGLIPTAPWIEGGKQVKDAVEIC